MTGKRSAPFLGDATFIRRSTARSSLARRQCPDDAAAGRSRRGICKRLRDGNAARWAVDKYVVPYRCCRARAATASVPRAHERQYHHLAMAKPHYPASGPALFAATAARQRR
jgi:hypothetical protein